MSGGGGPDSSVPFLGEALAGCSELGVTWDRCIWKRYTASAYQPHLPSGGSLWSRWDDVDDIQEK